MLSIGSTVRLSFKRHRVNAILSFRKSLRSGELRFYLLHKDKTTSLRLLEKKICDSVGLSSALPAVLGKRYRTGLRALTP